MKKNILKVVRNKKNNKNFDVTYQYIGSNRGVIRNIKSKKIRKDITIEEIFNGKTPIEEISINAFRFSDIKTNILEIPNGIIVIQKYGFANLKAETLILPISLNTIHEGAFADTTIETLDIPRGLTEIPENCFKGAIIKTLKLPSSILAMDAHAFSGIKIDILEIPEGVTEIPYGCFRESEIKSLKLPSSIETISHKAFSDATIDTPIYIKNILSIGYDAFSGFKGIIYTDNKESKDRFVRAGLDTKQVVNLSSREECFKALKNKTFQEIRQLEKDFGREIWDKDYLNTIQEGFIKNKNVPVDLKYSDMTLSDAAKLKKIMLDDSKKSKEDDSKILNKIGDNSMFDRRLFGRKPSQIPKPKTSGKTR